MTLSERTQGDGPHAGQRLLVSGAPIAEARLVMIMIHGRGGSPEDMAGLAQYLSMPDIAVIAPQADGHSWWPNSFLAPLEANEPGVSSGLSIVASLLDELETSGFGPERTAIIGFSQGGCLAIESAARLARPYRAVAALSGALIGTAESDGPGAPELYGYPDKQFSYSGRLDDVPTLLAVHERDPHIPLARLEKSAEMLAGMGAKVETIVMPGPGHSVVQEEIDWLFNQLGQRG